MQRSIPRLFRFKGRYPVPSSPSGPLRGPDGEDKGEGFSGTPRTPPRGLRPPGPRESGIPTLKSRLFRRSLLPWIGLLIALLLVRIPDARACSLDGIASLSMNGTTAGLTAGAPNAADARYWAPFNFLAVAPGDTLHFSEDLSKVRRSLSPQMLKQPFRWSFDDGSVVRGFSATHHFATLGWHKLTVSYFWAPSKRWIEFDSAQLRVVPASQLFQTNFAYHLENIVGGILLNGIRILVWGAAAVIAGAAILSRVQRTRRMRRI